MRAITVVPGRKRTAGVERLDEPPVAQAISCAFSEVDRGTLFVTTDHEQLDARALARQPDAVRVFPGPGSRHPRAWSQPLRGIASRTSWRIVVEPAAR
jgi:hypothetical protein